MHVLDNPVWHALAGPQRHLGTVTGLTARFDSDVAPFGAMDPKSDIDGTWTDLAHLVGPGGTVSLTGDPPAPPRGWTVIATFAGIQMVGDGVKSGHDPIRSRVADPADPADHADHADPGQRPAPGSPVRLGTVDVPEMLALVERTQPGPFLSRTVEFGRYLGIREHPDHRLVAMAGERMRPPGYVEISAVATDSDYQRRGFARLLVSAVAGGIVRGGQTPFLHVSATNSGAIRLYRSLGFTIRREVEFLLLEAPR